MVHFPKLETERLILSELHTNDLPQIIKHASNKNVSKYTINIPFPYSEKDAIYWINLASEGLKNRTQFIFAIRLKEQNQFIGGIWLTLEPRHLRAEIGYWLAESYWNKGFMTEVLKAVIDFGFTKLALNKISATHLEINGASGKVMMKCGMTQEGVMKEHILKETVFHNLIVYGLAKSDYANN